MTDIPLGDLNDAVELEEVVVTGRRPQIRNPFSISTFINELDKRGGPLTQNLFTVQITLPTNISRADDDRLVSLFCEAAPLPGISLGTDDTIQRYGYGPTQRAVWGTVFTSFNMDFIVDAKGTVPSVFTKWVDSIVNFNDPEHIMQANALGQPFMIAYHDDYATTMKVYSHDSLGHKVIATTYYDVFPIRIAEGQLSNSALNAYVKLSVSFSCTRWTTEYLDLDVGLNDSLTAANSRISSQIYANDTQTQFSQNIANDLNMTYRGLNFPSINSINPNIDDILLTNTNGILTGATPRPADPNFDIDSLFF